MHVLSVLCFFSLPSKDTAFFLKDSSRVPRLNFPQVPEVKLTQVVRSSKRIVAGAAAFQGSFDKKDVTSLGPPGPPLKTFLFESGAEDLPEYLVTFLVVSVL